MIHRLVQRDRAGHSSQERLLSIIREPIVTEKSTRASENNQYVFKVSLDANKIEIQRAIEHVFSVTVTSVNTLVVKGKIRNFRGRSGRASDFKKAIVRLKNGQSITFEGGGA